MDQVNSISPGDRRPLYVQAISAITQLIETGELPSGSKLPAESELAEMLGISRSTLREALGHLESFGAVTRQQGRGTFVTASQGPDFLGGIERLETFRALAKRANHNHAVVDRTVEKVRATEEIQEQLNVDAEKEIIKVSIVESIDGIPCMYLEDYVISNDNLFPKLNDYQGSVLTFLTENRNPPLAYARVKIYAVSAPPDVAQKLSLDENQPVLHLVEKMYDSDGNQVGLTFMYLVTDQFYFSVTRRIPPK